jgi:Ca2+-binding EF-hand superfamily protein
MNTRSATRQTNRLLKSWAVLIGSAVMATTSAKADDTSRFETADADSSGSLTLAEFKNALPGKQPPHVVEKKFNHADADDNNLVDLAEWLAFREEVEQEITDKEKHTARFNEADLDDDGFLSYEEFRATVKGKKPLIEVRKRYLRADTSGDLQISLDEWLDMSGDDLEKPFKHTKFALADLNGDNQLTPEEFATTFPRKTPRKTVLKKFNNEDENDDGYLTRDEWNPGGKGHDKSV